MDDDLVLVPKEDAKLLMELHRISEKGNCVDGLKYNKQSREWVYYEEVKHRKTVKVKQERSAEEAVGNGEEAPDW